jgi:hypothetical protein
MGEPMTTEHPTGALPAQTQLEPCPFCSGINIIHVAHCFTCWSCGAEGPDADTTGEDAAAAAWNRRAQPAGEEAPQGWLDIEGDRIVTARQMHSMLNHQGAPGIAASKTYTIPLYTRPSPTEADVMKLADSFYKHIAHGDDKHREWLQTEAIAWFAANKHLFFTRAIDAARSVGGKAQT